MSNWFTAIIVIDKIDAEGCGGEERYNPEKHKDNDLPLDLWLDKWYFKHRPFQPFYYQKFLGEKNEQSTSEHTHFLFAELKNLWVFQDLAKHFVSYPFKKPEAAILYIHNESGIIGEIPAITFRPNAVTWNQSSFSGFLEIQKELKNPFQKAIPLEFVCICYLYEADLDFEEYYELNEQNWNGVTDWIMRYFNREDVGFCNKVETQEGWKKQNKVFSGRLLYAQQLEDFVRYVNHYTFQIPDKVVVFVRQNESPWQIYRPAVNTWYQNEEEYSCDYLLEMQRKSKYNCYDTHPEDWKKVDFEV